MNNQNGKPTIEFLESRINTLEARIKNLFGYIGENRGILTESALDRWIDQAGRRLENLEENLKVLTKRVDDLRYDLWESVNGYDI